MNGKISSRLLIRDASRRLHEAGSESPYLDALLLLAEVWGVTRERLHTLLGDPVEPEAAEAFEALIRRRIDGEPVAYLTGYKEFFGHRFRVDHRVLVPRPDTEVLVETALDLCRETKATTIHDCCTGSGCVAISLAAARQQNAVSMSDLSCEALEVAVMNSRAILGYELPHWNSDLLSSVPGRFDIITCNPPYLTDREMMSLSVATADRASPERTPFHEPYSALHGGREGLQFINRLIRDALASLAPYGYIVLEIADAQADRVRDSLEIAGYCDVFERRDLAGRRRVVGGQACPDIQAVKTGTHG